MDPNTAEFLRLWAESGWRGNEVARRLGIHPSNVTLYRKQKVIPPLSKLRLLSEVTGLPLNLPGEDSIERGRALAPWESRLLHIASRIPAEMRERAIDSFAAMISALVPAVYRQENAPDVSLNESAGAVSPERKDALEGFAQKWGKAAVRHVRKRRPARPSLPASTPGEDAARPDSAARRPSSPKEPHPK